MLPNSPNSTPCTLRRVRRLRASLLAVGVTLSVPSPAAAQTPHGFTVDSARSSISWAASSSAGPLTARSPGTPSLTGSLDLDLHATQPVQALEIQSGSALSLPTLRGWIPSPNPFTPAPFDLRLSGPGLAVDSFALVVQQDGSFAAETTFEFSAGTANFSFFGAPRPSVSLIGQSTSSSVVTPGALHRQQDLFELHLPFEASFSIAETTSSASATVVFSGTLVATAPALDEPAHRTCVANGSNPNGCTPCPCGNDGFVGGFGGCLNGLGTQAVLHASGTNSATASDLRIDLSGAVPGSFALLLSGSQRGPSNPSSPCFGTDSGFVTVFSDGLRCITTDLRRHGLRLIDAQGTVGPGDSSWGFGRPGGAGLYAQNSQIPGQTRHFQAIYRDSPHMGCGTGRNSSDALSITATP